MIPSNLSESSCESQDPDLLLVVHGQADLMTQIRVGSHLCRCARCRRRYRELATVSRMLTRATSLSEPSATASSTASPQTLVVAAVALTIVVGMIAAVRPWLLLTSGNTPAAARSLDTPKHPQTSR